jgi:hypothetical protein
MGSAQTKTEIVWATLKKGHKKIIENIEVELNAVELSSDHQVLHGSFEIPSSQSLVAGFYELALKGGGSYQILVKEVIAIFRKDTLVSFLVVPKE